MQMHDRGATEWERAEKQRDQSDLQRVLAKRKGENAGRAHETDRTLASASVTGHARNAKSIKIKKMLQHTIRSPRVVTFVNIADSLPAAMPSIIGCNGCSWRERSDATEGRLLLPFFTAPGARQMASLF